LMKMKVSRKLPPTDKYHENKPHDDTGNHFEDLSGDEKSGSWDEEAEEFLEEMGDS
jgi:hypothetical protein